MKSAFKATVVLSLEQHTNDTIPSHISTSVGLSPSSSLEESMYIDENSLLTEDGSRVLYCTSARYCSKYTSIRAEISLGKRGAS